MKWHPLCGLPLFAVGGLRGWDVSGGVVGLVFCNKMEIFMKKSLIAGAVALAFAGGAAGVASAQATLFGVVDGGVTHTKFKNATGDKATNNGFMNGGQAGNRWGVRGSEDLGNGLQAVYLLESGFNLNNGQAAQGSRLFGREAVVGLASSDFGRVLFGRQPIFGYRWFSNVAAAGAFSHGQTRYDNQIQYQSPSFEGVQVGLGYSFNTNGGSGFKTSDGTPNQRAWTSAVRYVNGPLAAVVTYDSVKQADYRLSNATPPVVIPQPGTRASAWYLAASYDFSVAKVHAAFGANRNGWLGQQRNELRNAVLLTNTILEFNQGFRSYSYGLGVSVPVDANSKVMASWSMVDPDKAGVGYGVNPNLQSQHIYSLGYNYALSKRTNVYALASYADDLVLRDGNKARSLGVGLRHNF